MAVRLEINRKQLTTRQQVLAELDQKTLADGFYGEVAVKYKVEDGIIQQDIEVVLSDKRRVGK